MAARSFSRTENSESRGPSVLALAGFSRPSALCSAPGRCSVRFVEWINEVNAKEFGPHPEGGGARQMAGESPSGVRLRKRS